MANKRFDMSPNKTLEIVQSLYERKLVSYPRSDCNFLPSSQQADGAVILQNLAASGIPRLFHEAAGADPSYAGSKCWNDKKVTIHTAIIPTMKPVISSDLSQEVRDIYFSIAFNYLLQFYPLHRFKKTDFTIFSAVPIHLQGAVGKSLKKGSAKCTSRCSITMCRTWMKMNPMSFPRS